MGSWSIEPQVSSPSRAVDWDAPGLDDGPVKAIAPITSLVLTLACALAVALLGRDLSRSLESWPKRWDRINSQPVESRARDRLEEGVPGLLGGTPGIARAASLLDAARDPAGPFELRVCVVAPGGVRNPLPTFRSGSVLFYLLAPEGEVHYLPLEEFEAGLRRSHASALDPRLLTQMGGAELFLFHSLSRERIEVLREEIRTRMGADLLVPLRSSDDANHLWALSPLITRIRSGGEAARRYGGLLE